LNTDYGVITGTAATILMKNDTILVLADPAEPQLTMLANQLAGVKIIAGNSAEVFEAFGARQK
jgi:hypothetical protein